MKQTELIIFVVIMVINAVFAIVKKYKERQARNAAAALERAITNNAPAARATSAARTTPAMRATTAARATTTSARAGGATSIDARGSVRLAIAAVEIV